MDKQILLFFITDTVQMLYRYCTDTVQILYGCCTVSVQSFNVFGEHPPTCTTRSPRHMHVLLMHATHSIHAHYHVPRCRHTCIPADCARVSSLSWPDQFSAQLACASSWDKSGVRSGRVPEHMTIVHLCYLIVPQHNVINVHPRQPRAKWNHRGCSLCLLT